MYCPNNTNEIFLYTDKNGKTNAYVRFRKWGPQDLHVQCFNFPVYDLLDFAESQALNESPMKIKG